MYGKRARSHYVCERKRNLLCSPAAILSKNKTNTLPLPSNNPPCRANIQAKLHSATSPSLCLSLEKTHTQAFSCLVERGKGNCIIHPWRQSQQPDPERTHAGCRSTCGYHEISPADNGQMYCWYKEKKQNKQEKKNAQGEEKKKKLLNWNIRPKPGALNHLTPSKLLSRVLQPQVETDTHSC